MWLEHSKMLINEYRLDLITQQAFDFLHRRCEEFFWRRLRAAEGVRRPGTQTLVPTLATMGFRTSVQVRFGDVDHAGIVYYPHFSSISTKRSRTFFNDAGISLSSFDERRIGFPLFTSKRTTKRRCVTATALISKCPSKSCQTARW